MKRYLISFVSLSLVFIAACAGAGIGWIATEYDFGAFDEDSGNVGCTFRYVNTGDSPLSIVAARASCGCTSPRYGQTPVAPGDTGTIYVSYDPAGRPGRFSKHIYIDANTEPRRSTLTIKGVVVGSENTVKSRFPVDMGRLKLRNGAVMMGEVNKGHIKTVFLDGYNRSQDTLRPLVKDLPPYMEVTAIPKDVPPGEQVSFNFYLRSDRCDKWGIVSDSVTVVPDPTRPQESYPLSVVAVISEDFGKMLPGQLAKAPKVAVSTERIDFDRITGDGPLAGSVTISNEGKDALLVRRVYTQDKGIEVKIDKKTVKRGKTATLSVTVDPALMKGDILNARVMLITNDPDNPTVTIRVVGTRER